MKDRQHDAVEKIALVKIKKADIEGFLDLSDIFGKL